MATNPYFDYNVKSEQNLYEDLAIEAIQIYGQNAYYIPRESFGEDIIFNDDILQKYDDAYLLEVYIENPEGFDGEGDLFTKFGVEIRDAATFVIARKRWKEEVVDARPNDAWYRPREGDLIWLSLSQSLFQIHRVDTESPFFQISDLPIFKLSCELYEYSNEQLNTGIDAIDNIEKFFAYQYKLTMSDSATGYIVGETVTQVLGSGDTMTGEVIDWHDSSNYLFIAHAGADDGDYHDFVTGRDVVGGTSGATYQPTLVEQLQNIQKDAQNEDFDTESVDFLDFSESNPFGDP